MGIRECIPYMFVSKILIGRHYVFVIASTIFSLFLSHFASVCYLYCYYYRTWSNALLGTHTQKFHHTAEEKNTGVVFFVLFCFLTFCSLFFLHHFRFGEKQTITIKIGSKERKQQKKTCILRVERNGKKLRRSESVCEWVKKQIIFEHWNKAKHHYM